MVATRGQDGQPFIASFQGTRTNQRRRGTEVWTQGVTSLSPTLCKLHIVMGCTAMLYRCMCLFWGRCSVWLGPNVPPVGVTNEVKLGVVHQLNTSLPCSAQPNTELYCSCETWGRPRRRWIDNIKMDLLEIGLVWLRIGTGRELLWTR
jgi:hypothetical protein